MSEPELTVDIPNEAGWPMKSVDSLCSLISRGTAPVYVEHSEVLAIGQRCVTSTEFASHFARPHSNRAMRNVLRPEFGDVLLNSTGTGTIGRSVVFSSPSSFIVDGHVTVMRPRSEIADSRWLNSVLRAPSFQRHLERFCFAGSTNQLELSRTPLRLSRLPTPHIDDQRAMRLVIDTLDIAIHETEAIIAKLKAVKQGLLQDLLTRGIAANGELRSPQAEAPHLYKESPLGWIPKKWDFAPLVSKIDFPEGQVDPRRAPYRDWVLIAPDHIESATGRLLSTATAAEQKAISGKYVFQAGDVIYSKIRPYLRKAVLASSSGLCSADMYPLRPKTGIDSRYLLAVVLGDQYSRFAESVSMRSGFPKINRNEMTEFSIGWPSPEEQSWIVQILSSADVEQRSEEVTLEKLRPLKEGLMDDLLTGRVRVAPLLAEAAQKPGST